MNIRAYWVKQALGTIAIGLIGVGAVGAQEKSDLVDQVRRIERVAAQKTETEIGQILREAQRVTGKDPLLAREMLQDAIASLQEEQSLPPQRRAALQRMLKDQIRNLDESVINPRTELPADNLAAKQFVEENRKLAEREEIQRKLKAIAQMRLEGRMSDARKAADDLARRFPAESTATAADRTGTALDQLKDGRLDKMERNKSTAAAQREISRSAAPTSRDVEYAKDWAERTKNRTGGVPMTVREKSIVQALNTPITVSFNASKLDTVLEYLQTYTGQTIMVDRESLKEAESSYDSPITVNVKNVTVRTLLRKIFGEFGMTYIVKDEVIQVTSQQRAKDMMIFRSYYVGDVLASMGGMPAVSANPLMPQGNWGLWQQQQGQQFGLGLQPQYPASTFARGSNTLALGQHANTIIEMIQSSIDPSSWRKGGGEGTVTFHAPSMSLLVKQSAEVHALMGNSGLVK